MKPTRAVIPAAAPGHGGLPLQHLATGDGSVRRVLDLHIRDLLEAGLHRVAVVIAPAARPLFASLASAYGGAVELIEQPEPRGFGDAVRRAEAFTAGEPFLLQVCDHVFVSEAETSCARQLLAAAAEAQCAVSAVQPTHESLLPSFGAVAARRVRGRDGLYEIEAVLEKTTPTVAEQRCLVPGLRHGYYLCFFGLHVLPPSIFALLAGQAASLAPGQRLGLSEALDQLSRRERHLAFVVAGRRVDLEGRFGLVRAQLALGLAGPARDEVLQVLLEEAAASRSRPSP